jgi:hypothetical protein
MMEGLADGDPTSVAVRDGFRTAYATLAYDLVLPRIERRLADTVVASGNPEITDALITSSEWETLVDDLLVDGLGDSSLDGLLAAGFALGVLSTGTALFADAVNEQRDSMYTFGDFLRDQIEDWWQSGRTAGWSPGQFREQVESFTSPVSQARADVAARVNEASALNAGVHTGLNDADVMQHVAAVTWLTMRDARVRDAHRAVDADIVAVGTPFTMSDDTGIYEARFPGDPRLPIGLRINCRCRLGYVEGTQVRRAVYGTRRELLERATDLGIRGRHGMSKPELQMAVLKQLCLQGLASGPDCPDLLEHMNRTALLTLARQEGIRGRYSMTREQLVQTLSSRLSPSDPVRASLGYATDTEIREARRRATAMRRRTPPATGNGQLPRPELRHGQRGDVFAEFGGTTRGYVPCVHCGLRLGATRDSGLAVLVPEPIIAWSAGGTLNVANLLPSCAGCFQAGGGRGLVASATFATRRDSAHVGSTVRALAIGAESVPAGERTVTLGDAPVEVVQLGVLHAVYVADLDYTAYTVNGIPVDPASAHPVESGVMTFASRVVLPAQEPPTPPPRVAEHFDGTVADVDATLDLSASQARMARYLAKHRAATFHANHDQSTHGNWATGGRDAPGGGVPVSGYVDYTEVDGVGGSFDVTPGYGPNVARFDWKDDVLDALSPGRVEAAHDTTMEVHFVTDADGNILEANATWLTDDPETELQVDADNAAVAAFEAHFEALGINTRAPVRREYAPPPPEIGEEGWVPRSALGTVMTDIGTFKVGDEEYSIRLDAEYADEWGDEDPDSIGTYDGTVRGHILDANGNTVGSFERSLSGGELTNSSLNIYREGQGIGTAFLDVLEGRLSSEGWASTVSLQAVDVGRYAWAARGYAYNGSPTGGDVPRAWIEQARTYYYDEDDGTISDPVAWEKLDALESEWSDYGEIYPIDLVGIDAQLKAVLLDGPSWYGVKDIDTRERPDYAVQFAVELQLSPSDIEATADLVEAGTEVAVPRAAAASIVEAVGADGDPVDLTVLSIEDTRFFAVVATNELARDDMPQIPTELLGEFRTRLGELGIMSWADDTDPFDVFATQHHLDARKVAYMIGAIRAGELDALDVPILVSSDDRLLDGHHRWAAEVLLAAETPRTTTTIRFATTIASLLELAHDFAAAHGIESKSHGMAVDTVEFRFWKSQPRQPAGRPDGGQWAPASQGGPVIVRTERGWESQPLDPIPRSTTPDSIFRGPLTTPRQRYESGDMEPWEKRRYEAELARREKRNALEAQRRRAPSVLPGREDRESISGGLFGRNTDLFGDAEFVDAPFREATPVGLNQDRVDAAIANPLLARVDPRVLHVLPGSQIGRAATEYYAGSDYDRTGRPYGDADSSLNLLPVVWRNADGTHILLSGKSRATAALLAGEAFDTIVVSENTLMRSGDRFGRVRPSHRLPTSPDPDD